MSTETLGIRVDLTGDKAAAAGLQGVATAEKALADATGKVSAASKDAKGSGDALNTTINQTAASSTRGGAALAELEARSRSLANSQQGVAASLAGGVSQAGLLARVMGAVALAGTAMAAALAVAAPAIYFTKANDEAKVLLSRITQVTGSLQESRAVYRGLTEDAVRLRVGLGDTLSGYTRISAAVKELGGTSVQARQLNEIVIGTAKIMGVSAGEAAAAARQFAQALGSGVLQGDELRSILENNQELARQLAGGLGVSIGALRKMGEEGRLTADVVANALLSRLGEIRGKLADVPLTTADAWQKFKTVLEAWVVQGDNVEMKAGAMANRLNQMATAIEEARQTAAKPIIITVRTVQESEGGAAFTGANGARRFITAQTLSLQERENEMARLTNKGNGFSALGVEAAAKAATEAYEKYADSVELGSVKIQKAADKAAKDISAKRLILQDALTRGDPDTAKKAGEALSKLAELEIRAATDTARKIADARRSEASRGNSAAKADQGNAYREAIAQQEAYQATLEQALTAESSALKRQYDQRKISAQDYYGGLAAMRLIALAQQEESVRRELEVSQSAVARGDASKKADVAKYTAEIERFKAKRISVAEETEDAITAIETRARDERLRAQAEANARFNDYLNQSGDLVRAMQAENEQRQFELSLIGLTEQAAGQMQARRQAELTMRRALTQAYREYIAALNASDSNDRDKSITDAYNKQVAGIRAVGAEQADLTIKVQQTGTAYSQMSSFVDGFINAAFSGFKSLKDFLKNQVFDWLKQSLLKPFIMQIAASVTGGLAGTVANAATGSGGSSIVGSVASMLLGPGTFLGSLLGTGGLAAAGTAFTGAISAGAGVVGAFGAASASLVASGGILGAAAGVLAAIPVVGWIALAAGALALALGGRKPGFKIDNNLTNVGNPASHFTRNPIADYDVSGRGTDGAETRAALAPLHTALATIDGMLATKLLGPEVIDKIRANMNRVNNASSWENLDAKGIEKGTKDFLMQRYGVIFDEIDAKIAASVRGFTGTSEELLRFIGGVVAVMGTLKDNAAYFATVIGETVSVGQLTALQKEGEALDQTLTRVVNVFTITNGVAALMGRDVTTAFGAVGLASLEARQNLIDLAGGIQALDQMSQFFYENFYTEAERGARDLAAANASVAATFAEMKLSVPATRDEFRALVEAQDLTTEAGRRQWTALMRIAAAFDVVHDAAEAATPALTALGAEVFIITRHTRAFGEATVTAAREIERAADTINAINIGTVLTAGAQMAQDALASIFSIIDSTSEATNIKLGRKIAATGALAAQLDAQYRAQVTADGGNVFAGALAIAQARDLVLAQQAALAGNLALFTTMQAQYGQFGEQMYELELWHREQVASAMGNQATLLLIEQSYQARREAILNGGVASGLSSLSATLRAWLNGLLLNNQLSVLTPAQRLAEARSQFEASLISGDASRITGSADAYLREARDYFASSDAYTNIFNMVRAAVGALTVPGGGPPPPPPSVSGGGGRPLPPVVGSVGGGSSAATAASTVAASAATTAVAAANATVDAVNQTKAILAEIMAQTKNAVVTEAETTRAADVANTSRVVAAVTDRGSVVILPRG